MVRACVIACKVLEEELSRLAPAGCELCFLDQDLHRSPERLRLSLQEALRGARGCDLVLLGYGYCGGALEGLRAGTAPLVVPRVDDCITLLLGSHAARRRWGQDAYFLSAGWLAGEGNIVWEYERCLSRYGEERGTRLMRQLFRHYRRLVFINTGRQGEEAAREAAREVAGKLGLEFLTCEGQADYLEGLLRGPWDDGERFVRVPPGGEVCLTPGALPGPGPAL
ncbi:DUF1638 domain-containing protein [Desulfovirgula thermocuniculi]|uniref:DUF1638 domain-containing protein n=1 Tax=Desulfovirgula thermocuniculi TaxID=348842 RepID=UPI000423AFE5|nr:DUF1638 domain-containing protein [Desulfovirgula thermocuniculi]